MIDLSGLITKEQKDSEEADRLCAAVRQERDARLASVLSKIQRHQLQAELNITTENSSSEYMDLLLEAQLLREVPQQDGFPTNVNWPHSTNNQDKANSWIFRG